jgi:hypothetical protein
VMEANASNNAQAAAGSAVAAVPSISVSETGLREMLKLSGSASATIQILNVLYDRGVKVNSFDALVTKFKQHIVTNYQ